MDPRAAPPQSSSLLRRSGYAKAQSALAEALDPNSGAAPPQSSSLLRRSGYAKAQSALAEAPGN